MSGKILVAIPVREYPHNPKSFTQGLVFHQDSLYESTGLEGFSSVKEVDLETGKTIRQIDLDPKYFGEGMTILNNLIYVLTWKHKIGFIYDLESFRLVRKFSYPVEGWGLTNDGENLIMSSGKNVLYFISPHTFRLVKKINVSSQFYPSKWGTPPQPHSLKWGLRQGGHGGVPHIHYLNALQYIHGLIYANIWQTPYVAIINPSTGQVAHWIDLSHLGPIPKSPDLTANGIAYDYKRNILYATGKMWDKLYEIRLIVS